MEKSEIGMVSNNSIVPDLISSLKKRIVIAGMRNKNTHGAMINKPSMLAYPELRIFKFPSNTKRNNPVIHKNTVSTKYPIRELKKLDISFLNNEIMIKTSPQI